jgi:ElaB/YqjD/DUF883 family membrane-anchored ribosome-binding protein
MSDARIFPEGTGKSSQEVDDFLDDLAHGQHEVSRPVTKNANTATAGSPLEGVSATSTTQAGDATQKGQQALSTAREKASEMTSQATAKASEGIDKATEMLRERGEQTGGTVGTAATTAANTLESASSYVRSKDRDQMMQDIEAFIREKPVESILIAAGAGFILSKILS